MSVWNVTCRLLARYLAETVRLDHLLEDVPGQMSPVERRRCRHLLYGVVRNLALLEHAVGRHVRTRPRPVLRAALLVGAFELFEHHEDVAAIVHHAVEEGKRLTSAGEARMINAVLRRAAETLREITTAQPPTDVAGLALRFSHPEWLVERWLARFGLDATRALLAWNQEPAVVHARLASGGRVKQETWPAQAGTGAGGGAELPESFRLTKWLGFFALVRPDWAEVERLLADGSIYVQDPATACAPDLLGVRPGECVLDVCAAPGGKTLQLAEAVIGSDELAVGGRVVAIDLPGVRLERLRENLKRHPALPVSVLGADATQLDAVRLVAAGLPGSFDAVLLDVPCSNTGVLRHRVDAKWRIQPRDLEQLPGLQLDILRRGAALVKPGGRLCYSTCSLEPEENEDIVGAFLKGLGGGDFVLERSEARRPWVDGCDGAGAVLLHRRR